ncbi:outer membrane protein assembly factor [Zobellella endophytica]|uniref:Translocation and assembly module subunit TamA n=1 Tax=Zobellella endophytica TaxID=2116700 RepID=A0A2P7R604_9GAMM|nr:autotransporter assembly complex family protein [Zobellella endophytica]PSJ45622.1 outer membrane protein assembly factor [Zobellella endophytica]
MSKGVWGIMGLMLLSLAASAEEVSFRLSGLSGALEDNTRVYLNQLPPIQAEQLPRFRKSIVAAVEDSLQALGYYRPEIEVQADDDDPARVTIRVTPGEPVRIRKLDVLLQGDAASDPLFEERLGDFALDEGDILNHETYEGAKASLLSLALARGYFDAGYRQSQVRVHPWENAADVVLSFDSGPRFRFGELRVDTDRPVDRLLNPLVTVQPGDPYLASQVAELSRSLSSTRYFRQVEVLPLVGEADEEHRVPLSVVLRAKADNEVELGVGFSTDEGPRTSVSWEKPWINSLGHSFNTSLKLSAPKQDITFVYKIPRGHPLDNYYTLQGGYQRLDQDDTESDRLVASVHRWDKNAYDWTRDVFIRSEYESYTQGQQEDDSFLLIPGVSYSRTRVRGGLDPYWGDAQIATLELSEPWWGSDTRFVRLWGRSKWLRSLSDDHRLIARAEQGAVWVDEVNDLPPSLRFFTGGDLTVRGFGYESITPVDANGDRLGAKYATALSLEYDYRVAEKWRLATFVDTGTATNDYSEPWKVGTGVGVRWLTPVGSVRFDLAFGVSEDQVPWRLHFTLGPEL